MKRRKRLPPTQKLRPAWVIDPDAVEMQRNLERKKAADTRRAQGRLPDAVLTEIAEYCRLNPGINSSKVAQRLKNTKAPLVMRWNLKSLAKKVALVRPPKIKR